MPGIQYPVDIKDIGKFEHQNNISVNLYGYEDKKSSHYVLPPWPLQDITADETSHYVLVKGLSRLASSQYNNYYHKKYFCQYFLHGCTSEEVLKNYLGRCKLHGAQRIKLPEADNKKGHGKVKFTKTEYQLRLPFVIYADFESVLHKTRVNHRHQNCSPPNTSITSCICVKCSDGQYFEPPQVHIGDDATEKFLDQVLAAATICRQHLTNKIPMKRLTQEQWREYNNATNCSICARSFKSAEKKSATTIIWQVNIEVQLTTHATWITTSIQRKWNYRTIRNPKGMLFLWYSYLHDC